MQGVATAKEEDLEDEARTITLMHKEEAQHVERLHLPSEAGRPRGNHRVEEARARTEDEVEWHFNRTHHPNRTAMLDPNHRLQASY